MDKVLDALGAVGREYGIPRFHPIVSTLGRLSTDLTTEEEECLVGVCCLWKRERKRERAKC